MNDKLAEAHARREAVDRMSSLLRPGMTLANGVATCIAYRRVSVREGVVLAMTSHDYVVWRVMDNGMTYAGDYYTHARFADAVRAYEVR